MLKLALKGAWARKLRLSLLVLIIMASVGFIAGTFVFTDTLKSGFGDVFGTVYKDTSAVVRGEKIAEDADDFDQGARGLVPGNLVDTIRTDPTVSAAEGSVESFVTAFDKKGKKISFGPPTFAYAWNDTPGANPYKIAEGTTPQAPDETVINKQLARIGTFKVGETIQVSAGDKPETFKIVGIAKFGTTDGSTADLLFQTATAQRLAGYNGNQFTSVFVVGKPGTSQEEVRDSVAKTIGDDRFEVLTGEQITDESQEVFAGLLDGLAKFLLGFGLLALLVGVFVIYNTFSILIAQRQREVALLRAVGASGAQMRRAVLIEATILGAVGALLGIGFGVVMALGLKALFAAFGAGGVEGSLQLQPRTILVAGGAGFIATVASAYFPARRASSIPPIAAMQGAALDKSGTSRIRTIAGAGTIAVGLALLAVGLQAKNNGIVYAGLAFLLVIIGIAIVGPILVKPVVGLLGKPLPKLRGMAGQLAKENAIRNPRRTASSALALTIGVAVVAFFFVVGESIKASVANLIDKQFTADYIVTAGFGQPGGIKDSVADDLGKIEGVGDTTALRFTNIAIDDKVTAVIGANPATAGNLFDFGKVSGSIAELTGDTIAVKQSVAEERAWTLGSTVKAQLETGPADLKVAAIFEKNDAVGAEYLMGLDTLTTRSPSIKQNAAVVLALEPGADITQVRADLDKAVKDYPSLEVQDRADFKRNQASQVNALLIFISILLVLAIIIAIIGIAITLSLSIFERIRELGVLRAVGQQRSQTRSMVRWEAVLISLLGTVVGLLVGTVFGVAIVKAANEPAFNIIRVPMLSLIVIGVLGALAGVGASLWPAAKASRTDIMAALASS